MENEAHETSKTLGTILAVVIAVVTVLSALVSWRAEMYDHIRVEEDLDGLLASVNAQETRILDQIAARDDLAAYTRWWQYSRLAESIAKESQAVGAREAERMSAAFRQYLLLSQDNKILFPNRYLTPDGGYDLDRQLGEMWADAADETDLFPAPHFEQSDSLIHRSLNMLAAGAILSVALVFYALVESLGIASRHARWLLAAGCFLSAAGIILALFTHFNLV